LTSGNDDRDASSTRQPDEQLIGALIPTPLRRPQPAPPSLPRLPLPRLFGDGGLRLDAAHVDPSGRIAVQPLQHALCWPVGQLLAFDVVDRIVIVKASHVHGHAVGARGTLALPAAVRHMAGIDCGATVIVAADLATQTLLVHPEAVVARLLADNHARFEGGRHDR
jgi:hypothetical protein